MNQTYGIMSVGISEDYEGIPALISQRSNLKVSKTAIVVAVSNNKRNATRHHEKSQSESRTYGNVNIWLGAAMLSSIIMVLILLCYCCHKNNQKHRPHEYVGSWQQNTDFNNFGVFMIPSAAVATCGLAIVDNTVDRPSRPSTRGPPPAYESLNLNPGFLCLNEKMESQQFSKKFVHQASTESELEKNWINDEDLPTYEVALRLETDKTT